MANKIHNLMITRGRFQVKGITNGTTKDKFYTQKVTKTGKDFRMINFGCEYDEKKTLYMSINGMPQTNVYFSKRNKENGKVETKAVPWNMREKFNEDGYNLIGVHTGLSKITNSEGKIVNDRKVMHSFDACNYINSNMTDDMSVFIKGDIEYSSFIDDNGDLRRSKKLIPNQISLCQDVVFSEYDDDNKPVHDFSQTIVFMGIDQEIENNKATGRFVVSAKIVTYNDIVDTEFIITNSKLATNMKKNLKPYNAIDVHGNIEVTHVIEDVLEDDGWGESNPMTMVSGPSKTEFIITGADPMSIDKDTYSEDSVDEAISKIRNAQNAEKNFGNVSTSSTNDSNDPWDDDLPGEDLWD